MRNLLTILFLFFCLASFGQRYMPFYTYGNSYQRLKADSVQHVPRLNDTLLHTTDTTPQVRVFQHGLWLYDTYWKQIGAGGTGGGTVDLSGYYTQIEIDSILNAGKFIINQKDSVQNANANFKGLTLQTLHVYDSTSNDDTSRVEIVNEHADGDANLALRKSAGVLSRAFITFGEVDSAQQWNIGILKGATGVNAPFQISYRGGLYGNSLYTFSLPGFGIRKVNPAYELDVAGYGNFDSGAYVPNISPADSSKAVVNSATLRQAIAGLGGGSVDISGKVNISDTAGMLSPYLRANIAAATYQAKLSGTGIVKSTGGTISYITDNSSNWNTAFGWGNHASAGYLTNTTGDVRYPQLTGGYSNPAWITTLAWSKITGAPSMFSGDYNDLTNKPTLGTAAALNAPSSGSAASGEVVKGNDTRLTDARTPTAHTHSESEVTGLTADLASKADASTLSAHIANTSNPHSVTASQLTLTGLSTASSTAVTASDNVLQAAGKLQAQINTNTGNISTNTAAIAQKAGFETAATFASISTTRTDIRIVYVVTDETASGNPSVYLYNGTTKIGQLLLY